MKIFFLALLVLGVVFSLTTAFPQDTSPNNDAGHGGHHHKFVRSAVPIEDDNTAKDAPKACCG